MNIILITACPSGMATTFLAAKRLEQAAQRQGWVAHVEMYGEVAPLQAATAEQIANADLIVVAADHVPAPERFEGKRLFKRRLPAPYPTPATFWPRTSGDRNYFFTVRRASGGWRTGGFGGAVNGRLALGLGQKVAGVG